MSCISHTWQLLCYCFCLDEPPKVTSQPKRLNKAVSRTAVSFIVQATGTTPLSYEWQWKPAEEKGEWQPCNTRWADGATLTIPSVQKSNEGWYHCIISNCAGTVISKPVQLSVGKNNDFTYYLVPYVRFPAHVFLHVAEPPRITSHPQELKDAVPGKPVMFTVEGSGTAPLNYQWEWKLATEDGKWQPCDVKSFPGADSSTLTIPSVQESNEGGYRCVISNCAGNQTSKQAQLSVGKNPYYFSSFSVGSCICTWKQGSLLRKTFTDILTECLCMLSSG